MPFLPFIAADCTSLLQKQDSAAVAACKAQYEDAENAPASERMARMVAEDEYGVALLGIAHEPAQALAMFDREIALLPGGPVRPDSLQWAVTYWHRATAYQQLGQYDKAGRDLATAENTFARAITAAGANQAMARHFSDLRRRVLTQHADLLDHQGRHSEAQSLRTTQ